MKTSRHSRSHKLGPTLTYLARDLNDTPHRVIDLAEERLEGGMEAVTQQGVHSRAQLVQGELGNRWGQGACACVEELCGVTLSYVGLERTGLDWVWVECYITF